MLRGMLAITESGPMLFGFKCQVVRPLGHHPNAPNVHENWDVPSQKEIHLGTHQFVWAFDSLLVSGCFFSLFQTCPHFSFGSNLDLNRCQTLSSHHGRSLHFVTVSDDPGGESFLGCWQKPITAENGEMCSFDVCFLGTCSWTNPVKFCVFVLFPMLSVAAHMWNHGEIPSYRSCGNLHTGCSTLSMLMLQKTSNTILRNDSFSNCPGLFLRLYIPMGWHNFWRNQQYPRFLRQNWADYYMSKPELRAFWGRIPSLYQFAQRNGGFQ